MLTVAEILNRLNPLTLKGYIPDATMEELSKCLFEIPPEELKVNAPLSDDQLIKMEMLTDEVVREKLDQEAFAKMVTEFIRSGHAMSAPLSKTERECLCLFLAIYNERKRTAKKLEEVTLDQLFNILGENKPPVQFFDETGAWIREKVCIPGRAKIKEIAIDRHRDGHPESLCIILYARLIDADAIALTKDDHADD